VENQCDKCVDDSAKEEARNKCLDTSAYKNSLKAMRLRNFYGWMVEHLGVKKENFVLD